MSPGGGGQQNVAVVASRRGREALSRTIVGVPDAPWTAPIRRSSGFASAGGGVNLGASIDGLLW